MRKKFFISLGGYMTDFTKKAVSLSSASNFSIVNALNNKTVYEKDFSSLMTEDGFSGYLKQADFSDFNIPGKYYIKYGLKKSENFEISDDVYTSFSSKLLNAIYLNRCGINTAKKNYSPEYDIFGHEACHTEMVTHFYSEMKTDVSGGWHTGGEYGKSTVETIYIIAYLLYSYMLYNDTAPDGKGDCPSLLEECRWGLDWLMKMQAPSGAVYHKVDTAKPVNNDEAPDEDSSEQFIFPSSCLATALFTAITALASRVFLKLDDEYSKILRKAAMDSWIWIINTNIYERWQKPVGSENICCSDFWSESDLSECYESFLWAAVEIYILSGDSALSRVINEFLQKTNTTGFCLNSCGGFATLSYITSNSRKEAYTDFYLKKKMGDRADKICNLMKKNAFDCGLSENGNFERYKFSTIMNVISDCLVCQTAYLIYSYKKYLNASSLLMQYILGKNPLGMCFITGLNDDSPKHVHHTLSNVFGDNSCISGMVINGSDYNRCDEQTKWAFDNDTPPGCCYVDNKQSICSNSPSIMNTAALFMASQFFYTCKSEFFDIRINE